MKTIIICCLISLMALLSGCAKDTPVKDEPDNHPQSDYRDLYLGSFDCKITHYSYQQNDPIQSRDTFAVVVVAKFENNDTAIQFSYNNMGVAIKTNGVLYYYDAFDPHSDSLGYIDSDSIYLNYLLHASVGGRSWLVLKGKRK